MQVLIIGGGYAGIVQEMLKDPEVESIILYEIDEVSLTYHLQLMIEISLNGHSRSCQR